MILRNIAPPCALLCAGRSKSLRTAGRLIAYEAPGCFVATIAAQGHDCSAMACYHQSPMIRHLSAFFAVLVYTSVAWAQGQWTLTTADFHTQTVALKSVEASGVGVTPSGAGGGEKLIPFDQFLEVSRPGAGGHAGGAFVLFLAGGDQIGGEPIGIKGNNLAWNSPTLGPIELPLKRLIAMERAGPGARPPEIRHRQDIVTMINGDSVSGIIAGIKGGKLSVRNDTGSSDVPLASVKEVNFAASASGVSSGVRGFRVYFDDGSSVVATSITLAGDKLELSFGKEGAHAVDLNRVTAIEQTNGPVSWLSARPPAQSVNIPFFGTESRFPARMNRNYKGDPIRFGAQTFTHGIGVHSYSRLVWPLDGKYATFRTRYAIDTDFPNARADVTVRIKLDDKAVYEQQHVRAGTLSPVVLEELKGAKTLTLEVDYGANGDTEDRFNWIDPALGLRAQGVR